MDIIVDVDGETVKGTLVNGTEVMDVVHRLTPAVDYPSSEVRIGQPLALDEVNVAAETA